MQGLSKSPLALVALVIVLIAACAFAWTRYRAMTRPAKEDTIQLTVDELRDRMRRDDEP